MDENIQLTCVDCGQRLRRDSSGRLVHAGFGAVAACDLDADHPAVPQRRDLLATDPTRAERLLPGAGPD